MRTPWAARSVACVAVALLAVGIVGTPTSAAPGQELPPGTVVPPLPDETDPLTKAVSPVMWQACNGVGFAVGLIVLAGTLAGVPPEIGVPLNDAIATASGPALLTFFEVCQQIPLPEDPPTCETDELLPLLPSLGRPFLPAGMLANELRALDAALAGAGLPLEGALGDAADDLLACAAGRDPEPDPPAPGSDPDPDPGTDVAPTVGPGSPASGGGGPSSAPISGGTPPLPAPPSPASAPGLRLPVPQPVSSAGDDTSTGVAVALLGLAALAVLGWLHAGNPRPRRAPAPEIVVG